MLRLFIFKDTETGAELTLPVTPKAYQISHGRKAVSLEMMSSGDINLPGGLTLLDEPINCLLPSQYYPFLTPGAVTDPFYYIEQLEKWSDAGTVLRFIISDSPVNTAVILDPISYTEQDGTNDIYCTIPMRGYRELAAVVTENTGNLSRAVESKPAGQIAYIVMPGDTLSGIARRAYGDPAQYIKIAAFNGIQNVNLIKAGQTINLPDAEGLEAVMAYPSSSGGVRSSPPKSESTWISITVRFGGNSDYFGKGSISYETASGLSGMMTVESAETMLVPKGASVTIRWESLGGHSSDYRVLDGETIRNSATVSYIQPTEDVTFVIHWVK